ncbi:hypothetical protein M5K25_027157 [Dendrobium thyrsiflorum]|uniref:Peptidyl-prolyl cis-trans isomerase n=1 Tax=Dendrobium thyrsiflorum TaxID=117978 RepID=A0ABD0TZ89_DENTH
MTEGGVAEGRVESGKRKREKKTGAELSAAGNERIRASHILLKHEESRRKSSWRDPDGRLISITSRVKAAEQLRELREEIAAGRSLFEDVAAQHSHCSSAKRGGDLEFIDVLLHTSELLYAHTLSIWQRPNAEAF